ncbi:hypothetical protein [Paenibacillus elgii]|uniref:hypothetical protein n=1 Tax=Paenibacillus elgii TaxID=189691 RepID=UPI00203B060A|nr:hypothetical protein [Paenibacillus elgii]MCM3270864.1 hypothetical protein [Paenibacillus elgii]
MFNEYMDQRTLLAVKKAIGEYVSNNFIRNLFDKCYKTEAIRKIAIEKDRVELARECIKKHKTFKSPYYTIPALNIKEVAIYVDFSINKAFLKWANKLRGQDVQRIPYMYPETKSVESAYYEAKNAVFSNRFN